MSESKNSVKYNKEMIEKFIECELEDCEDTMLDKKHNVDFVTEHHLYGWRVLEYKNTVFTLRTGRWKYEKCEWEKLNDLNKPNPADRYLLYLSKISRLIEFDYKAMKKDILNGILVFTPFRNYQQADRSGRYECEINKLGKYIIKDSCEQKQMREFI